jgi:hypothetical protein
MTEVRADRVPMAPGVGVSWSPGDSIPATGGRRITVGRPPCSAPYVHVAIASWARGLTRQLHGIAARCSVDKYPAPPLCSPQSDGAGFYRIAAPSISGTKAREVTAHLRHDAILSMPVGWAIR